MLLDLQPPILLLEYLSVLCGVLALRTKQLQEKTKVTVGQVRGFTCPHRPAAFLLLRAFRQAVFPLLLLLPQSGSLGSPEGRVERRMR
jgi:hypothetical protein